MNDQQEGHQGGHGYQALKAKKNVAEILEVATLFEKTAQEFYLALMPKVSKNIRYLVEELAAEEAEHYQLFADLSKNPQVQATIAKEIATPIVDHQFSDYIHLPDLGDPIDDQSILQYALGREDIAMKQYQALAENTEAGPLHDLFQFLANEETKHKRELEVLYYQLVHK